MSQDMQVAQLKKELAEYNGKQFFSQKFTDSSPSKVVIESPYSADEKSVTTQTLADGNRIVSTSSARLFRDRQGRSRVEKSFEGSQVVTIDDPVSGERYILDEKNRTAEKIATAKSALDARRLELAVKMEMEKKAKKADEAKAAKPSGPTLLNGKPVDLKTEDLGQQVMEGVSVQGTRTVLTIPAGQIGNDRPIEVTTERWFSPELQMVVMSKRNDPRLGETLYSVTNIRRANPEISLFEVPSGYTKHP